MRTSWSSNTWHVASCVVSSTIPPTQYMWIHMRCYPFEVTETDHLVPGHDHLIPGHDTTRSILFSTSFSHSDWSCSAEVSVTTKGNLSHVYIIENEFRLLAYIKSALFMTSSISNKKERIIIYMCSTNRSAHMYGRKRVEAAEFC